MSKSPQTIDEYIAARSDEVQVVLKRLRALVNETMPTAEERMKWGAPTYINSNGHPVVYLYGGKDHANLGFVEGVRLNDPENVLKGSGQNGRHVKVFPGEDMPTEIFAALITQCEAI